MNQDHFPTPAWVAAILVPFLKRDGIETFAEPCNGEGDLTVALSFSGFRCVFANEPRFGGIDARKLGWRDLNDADAIITNPTFSLAYSLLRWFLTIHDGPVWLLLPLAYFANKGFGQLVDRHCTDIVVVGRVKWVPGSPSNEKRDVVWARFSVAGREPARFHNHRRVRHDRTFPDRERKNSNEINDLAQPEVLFRKGQKTPMKSTT